MIGFKIAREKPERDNVMNIEGAVSLQLTAVLARIAVTLSSMSLLLEPIRAIVGYRTATPCRIVRAAHRSAAKSIRALQGTEPSSGVALFDDELVPTFFAANGAPCGLSSSHRAFMGAVLSFLGDARVGNWLLFATMFADKGPAFVLGAFFVPLQPTFIATKFSNVLARWLNMKRRLTLLADELHLFAAGYMAELGALAAWEPDFEKLLTTTFADKCLRWIRTVFRHFSTSSMLAPDNEIRGTPSGVRCLSAGSYAAQAHGEL